MRKFLILVLLFSACAGVTAEERQEAIGVVVSKAEPPAQCRMIGATEGSDYAFGIPKYEVALENLKVEAMRRGADYVVLDTVRQPVPNKILVSGRIYECPEQGQLHAGRGQEED